MTFTFFERGPVKKILIPYNYLCFPEFLIKCRLQIIYVVNKEVTLHMIEIKEVKVDLHHALCLLVSGCMQKMLRYNRMQAEMSSLKNDIKG